MTTGWAAATTSWPTRTWPGRSPRSSRTPGRSRRPTANSWAGRCGSSAPPGSASSWTSAPAYRPRETCTRSPRRPTRAPGWPTWMSTRSRSRTAKPSWRATRTPESSRPISASRKRFWPPTGPGAYSTSASRSDCCWSRCCISSTTARIPGASWPPCATPCRPGATWPWATPPTRATPRWPRRSRRSTTAASPPRSTSVPSEEILRFFDGFELLDPGLVYIPEWRLDSPGEPAGDPAKFWGELVGVGRKP